MPGHHLPQLLNQAASPRISRHRASCCSIADRSQMRHYSLAHDIKTDDLFACLPRLLRLLLFLSFSQRSPLFKWPLLIIEPSLPFGNWLLFRSLPSSPLRSEACLSGLPVCAPEAGRACVLLIDHFSQFDCSQRSEYKPALPRRRRGAAASGSLGRPTRQ